MTEPGRIPTLLTERLCLRAFRPDDFEPYAEMMADPVVARFLTMDGRPLGRNDAWRALAMLAGCWSVRGFGTWAIEERLSGDFIGYAGPWQPEGWPGLEVGWGIMPERQGRGYATEAASAAVRWAHETLGATRVLHIIAPANAASQRVAYKIGASLVGSWEAPWSPPEMELWASDRLAS